MKLSLASLILTAGLFGSVMAYAQAPATAPAGSTGLCKDGSYTSNATKKGACAGHKGVKSWYGAPAEAAAPSKAAAPSAPAPAATKPMAAAPASAQAPAAMKPATSVPATAPAVGGGAGQVWVNSDSKVYHCPGTKYYGKTKKGEYMTESAAKAAGNHADHGKSCSK